MKELNKVLEDIEMFELVCFNPHENLKGRELPNYE